MLKRRFKTPRFRRPRRTSGTMMTWWVLWRVPIFLLIVLSIWWFGVRPLAEPRYWQHIDMKIALCGDRASAIACVVDGDTVFIGFGPEQRRIRLTGFDAPEINGACEAERRKADEARMALYAWLAKGPFEWDGGPKPPRDQYGRELREVSRVNGDGDGDGERESLADTMIDNGLASDSGWGASPIDWCA
ncbi:MAG: hypothetical protein ABJP70_01815 [Erythrobacter sp.]